MFVVYALYNKEKNKIYIGYTADLKKRLARHNGLLKNKLTSYTSKNAGNWVVFFKETYLDRIEAMKREKQLKSYQGRKFLKEKILNL